MFTLILIIFSTGLRRPLDSQAFYVCGTQLQNAWTYHELEAELFFLRGYVDFNEEQYFCVPGKNGRQISRISMSVKKTFYRGGSGGTFVCLSKYESAQMPTGIVKIPQGKSDCEMEGVQRKSWRLAAVKMLQKPSINVGGCRQYPIQANGRFFGWTGDVKLNSMSRKKPGRILLVNFKAPAGFTFDQLQAATSSDAERFDQELSRTE
ncbi:MAG: hypothetical protein U0519_00435 [Candidatus Gracilibacteria bacterium]